MFQMLSQVVFLSMVLISVDAFSVSRSSYYQKAQAEYGHDEPQQSSDELWEGEANSYGERAASYVDWNHISRDRRAMAGFNEHQRSEEEHRAILGPIKGDDDSFATSLDRNFLLGIHSALGSYLSRLVRRYLGPWSTDTRRVQQEQKRRDWSLGNDHSAALSDELVVSEEQEPSADFAGSFADHSVDPMGSDSVDSLKYSADSFEFEAARQSPSEISADSFAVDSAVQNQEPSADSAEWSAVQNQEPSADSAEWSAVQNQEPSAYSAEWSAIENQEPSADSAEWSAVQNLSLIHI